MFLSSYRESTVHSSSSDTSEEITEISVAEDNTDQDLASEITKMGFGDEKPVKDERDEIIKALKARLEELEREELNYREAGPSGAQMRRTLREPSAPPRPETPESSSDDGSTVSRHVSASARMTRKIRDNLEVISEFDGTNMAVETFLKEVVSLHDTIKPPENLFVQLIVAKRIVRQAKLAIDGYPTRTVSELSHALRREFGRVKGYDLAVLERQQCRQNRESMVKYVKRFNLLHQDVRRAITNNSGYSENKKAVLIEHDDENAAVQFIRNTDPDIRLQVKAQRPETLREAQEMAIEIENEVQIEREMYRNLGFNRRTESHNPPTRTPKPQQPVARGERPTLPEFRCYNCQGTGHLARNCPKPRQNFQNARPPKPPNLKYLDSAQHQNPRGQSSTYEWEHEEEASSSTPELQ
ncbi:uncharacterized protein LOC143371557 [Andrena cerasifolii]|uniref:uncharacterized protein LOC143371557 n=1 Tax=Andrena cerasifolii TaxID=2819439 RepID=UPI004037CC0D